MLCNVGVWNRRTQVASCPRANPASTANRDCSPLSSQLLLRFAKNCSQGGRVDADIAERNSSKASMTHLCHSMVSRFRDARGEVDDPTHVLQCAHSSRAVRILIKDCRFSQTGQYSSSLQRCFRHIVTVVNIHSSGS